MGGLYNAPMLILLYLLACDDTIKVPEGGENGGGTTPTGTDFCAVQTIFNNDCVMCHSAGGQAGGLDLETDPYAAIVGVESSQFAGKTLVVAGDAAGSLLYRKMSGTQSSDEGGVMPSSGALSADVLSVVETWINDGASSECGSGDSGNTGGDSSTTEGYHPDGWDDPTMHGMAAKFQEDTCLVCHGEDLTGGSVGVSCDTCHESGWRENCTFCHGGTDNSTGAPPVDIDNSTSDLSFEPHTKHVTETIHSAWECTACHTTPSDVLSVGHFLASDSTPGVAEVLLSGGLSASGSYDGMTCSNMYCHGNGQGDNGTISKTDTVVCGDCHSVQTGWSTMSGEHEDHLRKGLDCSDCHGETVDSTNTIISPALHVNGTPNLDLPLTYSGGTCTGSCHNENHQGRHWD